MKVIDVIVDGVIFHSRGEARRAIQQNAVSINGFKIKDAEEECDPTIETLSKGKRNFIYKEGEFIEIPR